MCYWNPGKGSIPNHNFLKEVGWSIVWKLKVMILEVDFSSPKLSPTNFVLYFPIRILSGDLSKNIPQDPKMNSVECHGRPRSKRSKTDKWSLGDPGSNMFPPKEAIIHQFWPIYNDLSRRLVTPNLVV